MASQPVHLPQVPQMPAVARILSRHDRNTVEAFIAVAIDLLDVLDPDPDIEHDGDEEDGQFSEDEPAARFERIGDGPGCEFSDGLEDGDSDYCTASDDRGTEGMPNARFNGYVQHKEFESDPDCERWHQPVELI